MSKVPPTLDGALGFNLDRAAKIFRGELIEALRGYDLTPEQWQVMAALWETEDEINQNYVAELTLKDKHNVSRILKRLEASGWIERTPDPTDARAQLIHSTEKGRRHRDEVRRTLFAHFARLDFGLSEVEQDTLLALLRKIRRRAEAP